MKTVILFSVALGISLQVGCAPTAPMQVYNEIQFIPVSFAKNPHAKLNWNWIYAVLNEQGFLPIEINVPDTVGAIYSGVSGLAGNVIQRIPFLNRWGSPDRPRPMRYMVLVPVARNQAHGAVRRDQGHGGQVPDRNRLEDGSEEFGNDMGFLAQGYP